MRLLAQRYYEESLQIKSEQNRYSSSNDLYNNLLNLGKLFCKLHGEQNLTKGLQLIEQALAKCREFRENKDHADTIRIRKRLGKCYLRKGQLDKALEHFWEAYRMADSLYTDDRSGLQVLRAYLLLIEPDVQILEEFY